MTVRYVPDRYQATDLHQTVDIENQEARRLVKRVDPYGKRTIRMEYISNSPPELLKWLLLTAVLTKPDYISKGAYASWLRLLGNEEERFKHGWYCVKQANQQQLNDGISWADARHNEVEFFKNTSPWNTLNAAMISRLGTQSLVDALGNILLGLIRSAF